MSLFNMLFNNFQDRLPMNCQRMLIRKKTIRLLWWMVVDYDVSWKNSWNALLWLLHQDHARWFIPPPRLMVEMTISWRRAALPVTDDLYKPLCEYPTFCCIVYITNAGTCKRVSHPTFRWGHPNTEWFYPPKFFSAITQHRNLFINASAWCLVNRLLQLCLHLLYLD